LVDHDTPDAAGGSGDEDWMHALSFHEGLLYPPLPARLSSLSL
jgi:hypothetical protein